MLPVLMRFLRNPNRSRTPRVLGLLALVIAVAVVAGVATAGPNRTPAPKPPAGSSAAYKRVIADQLRAIKRAEAGVRKIARASAKKKSRTHEVILLGGAADGKYLYWPRLTIDVRSFSAFDGESYVYRYELVRTDRETGKDEVLLDKKNAYAMAVYARGGRVAVQTFRTTEIGSRTLLRSTIYTAASTDTKLTAPVIEKVRLGNQDQFCSTMQNLTGLSSEGELIVSETTGTCEGGEQQELTAQLKLWKPDGSKQDLGPAAASSVFGSVYFGDSMVRVAGGKLVAANPYGPATSVRDIAAASTANLWTPSAKTFDVANDGTVAVIGEAPESNDHDDFIYAEASTASAKSKQPKPKYPFVIFPGGDANQPKLIAASKRRTEALRFCGSHLYAVIGGPALGGLFGDADDEAGAEYFLQLFPQFGLRDHEVLVYDSQGNFVRSAAKLQMKGLAAVGCNGDNLVLAVTHGDTVRGTEVTP